IVAGLRYINCSYKMGIRVAKDDLMVGSYPPKAEPHVYSSPAQEAPSGMMARGTYTIKSRFTDDDRNDFLSWEWAIKIKDSLACVPVLFCIYTAYLYTLATVYRPAIAENQLKGSKNAEMKFPTSLADLNQLASLLKSFKDDHPGYVFALFCSAYVYKQCFAIPGSVFMVRAAAAVLALLLSISLINSCGATGCYLMSRHFGKRLVERAFHRRLEPLRRRVQQNRRSLFAMLLSLRLFPMSPNWFLNMASPLLGVPLLHFFPSVFLGLMPYNFITVEAGCMLSSLTSVSDLFSTGTMLKLTVLSGLVAALLNLERSLFLLTFAGVAVVFAVERRPPVLIVAPHQVAAASSLRLQPSNNCGLQAVLLCRCCLNVKSYILLWLEMLSFQRCAGLIESSCCRPALRPRRYLYGFEVGDEYAGWIGCGDIESCRRLRRLVDCWRFEDAGLAAAQLLGRPVQHGQGQRDGPTATQVRRQWPSSIWRRRRRKRRLLLITEVDENFSGDGSQGDASDVNKYGPTNQRFHRYCLSHLCGDGGISLACATEDLRDGAKVVTYSPKSPCKLHDYHWKRSKSTHLAKALKWSPSLFSRSGAVRLRASPALIRLASSESISRALGVSTMASSACSDIGSGLAGSANSASADVRVRWWPRPQQVHMQDCEPHRTKSEQLFEQVKAVLSHRLRHRPELSGQARSSPRQAHGVSSGSSAGGPQVGGVRRAEQVHDEVQLHEVSDLTACEFGSSTLARPKSQIFNLQSEFTRRLPGLMSRCRILAECRYFRPDWERHAGLESSAGQQRDSVHFISHRKLNLCPGRSILTSQQLVQKYFYMVHGQGLWRHDYLVQVRLHQVAEQILSSNFAHVLVPSLVEKVELAESPFSGDNVLKDVRYFLQRQPLAVPRIDHRPGEGEAELMERVAQSRGEVRCGADPAAAAWLPGRPACGSVPRSCLRWLLLPTAASRAVVNSVLLRAGHRAAVGPADRLLQLLLPGRTGQRPGCRHHAGHRLGRVGHPAVRRRRRQLQPAPLRMAARCRGWRLNCRSEGVAGRRPLLTADARCHRRGSCRVRLSFESDCSGGAPAARCIAALRGGNRGGCGGASASAAVAADFCCTLLSGGLGGRWLCVGSGMRLPADCLTAPPPLSASCCCCLCCRLSCTDLRTSCSSWKPMYSYSDGAGGCPTNRASILVGVSVVFGAAGERRVDCRSWRGGLPTCLRVTGCRVGGLQQSGARFEQQRLRGPLVQAGLVGLLLLLLLGPGARKLAPSLRGLPGLAAAVDLADEVQASLLRLQLVDVALQELNDAVRSAGDQAEHRPVLRLRDEPTTEQSPHPSKLAILSASLSRPVSDPVAVRWLK
uniref:Conserved plasma membrane protein n=1 Tax=Macrostomum lignano TaxID=282301 RepID=A0A1I8JLT0_9PLAT